MKKWIIAFLGAALSASFMAGCCCTEQGYSLTAQSPDRQLQSDVIYRLRDDSITKPHNFGVTVENGIVYMRGSVPSNIALRARALSIAEGTPGVTSVVDELSP